MFVWQTVLGAVQPTPPPQHGWPAPPHVPQLPFMHVPAVPGHAEADEMHELLFPSQQPPEAHVLPSQHGCPAPPHCAQPLLLLQTNELPVHVWPAQHG
jgi:hypothetical protein